MFLTITAFLALLIVYIIFTSGYHRKRKRKPWPTYELYFNVWLVIWFLTAALIECFNAWRWNYGPHTRRTDVGQMRKILYLNYLYQQKCAYFLEKNIFIF